MQYAFKFITKEKPGIQSSFPGLNNSLNTH